MKKNVSALLKSLFITLGLHGLLTVTITIFSRVVQREPGQAILFLAVTLLLLWAVCLFATIRTDQQRILWGCYAIALGGGVILSLVSMLFYGKSLSLRWPGEGNMASQLFLLIILLTWGIGVTAATVIRAGLIGKESRESNRQVLRMRKGYRLEYPPVSKGKARLYAAVKGLLWVVWYHTLTGLLLFLLFAAGIEETMVAYISFPVLWCLMALLYGKPDSPHRGTFALSAALSNLLFFGLSCYFCMVIHTDPHKFRAVLHLDSVLTTPFDNPEQMLAIGIFFSIWVSMVVFAVGYRKRREE